MNPQEMPFCDGDVRSVVLWEQYFVFVCEKHESCGLVVDQATDYEQVVQTCGRVIGPVGIPCGI